MRQLEKLGQCTAICVKHGVTNPEHIKVAVSISGIGRGLRNVVGTLGLGAGALGAGATGLGAINEGLGAAGLPNYDYGDGKTWQPSVQAFRNANNDTIGSKITGFLKRPFQTMFRGGEGLPDDLRQFMGKLPSSVKTKFVGWNPDGTAKFEYSGEGSPNMPKPVNEYFNRANSYQNQLKQWGLTPDNATKPETAGSDMPAFMADGPSLTSTF